MIKLLSSLLRVKMHAHVPRWTLSEFWIDSIWWVCIFINFWNIHIVHVGVWPCGCVAMWVCTCGCAAVWFCLCARVCLCSRQLKNKPFNTGYIRANSQVSYGGGSGLRAALLVFLRNPHGNILALFLPVILHTHTHAHTSFALHFKSLSYTHTHSLLKSHTHTHSPLFLSLSLSCYRG